MLDKEIEKHLDAMNKDHDEAEKRRPKGRTDYTTVTISIQKISGLASGFFGRLK